MNQGHSLIRQRLRTQRAAAIAGLIFSLLFTTSMLLDSRQGGRPLGNAEPISTEEVRPDCSCNIAVSPAILNCCNAITLIEPSRLPSL